MYVFSIRGFQLASLPVHPAWWEQRTETQNKETRVSDSHGARESHLAGDRERERFASDSGVTM